MTYSINPQPSDLGLQIGDCGLQDPAQSSSYQNPQSNIPNPQLA
jgi:hypothetical protein